MSSFNSSNCPGSDVIIELLRAEHEQVKQRTDIIKQLIGWNCNPQHDPNLRRFSGKTQDMHKSITQISKESDNLKKTYYDPYRQISENNWISRHARCFDTAENENVTRPSRISVNKYYNSFLRGSEVTSGYSNKKSTTPQNSMKNLKQSASNYTMSKRKDDLLPSESIVPNYSLNKSKPESLAPSFSRLKQPSSIRKTVSKKTEIDNPLQDTKMVQVDAYRQDDTFRMKEDIKSEILDYKIQVNMLLQQITDLKLAARKYEEDKSDWITEKRRQIKILQQLRDASYEETKAAMNLTSWKLNDIQSKPMDYEESKTNWLLCKKTQIELLEKLRGVSLCEIKKSIQKMSSPMQYIDCDQDEHSRPRMTLLEQLTGSGCHELFSNDHVTVQMCSPPPQSTPTSASVIGAPGEATFDKDKININIMMRANNCNTNCCITSGLGHTDLATDNQNVPVTPAESRLVSLPVASSSIKNEKDLQCVRRKIEDSFGTVLFQNTYNLLMKLNCPDLILNSSSDNCTVADIVFNYIVLEKNFHSFNQSLSDKDKTGHKQISNR